VDVGGWRRANGWTGPKDRKRRRGAAGGTAVEELPFLFAGSAKAAGGGLAMLVR
jgi:hypothetical protein